MAYSQESNRVNYSQLGLSFVIPNQWQGSEVGDAVLLQSPTIPGVILISTHNQTLAQLKAQANQTINDNQGTYLQPMGSIESLNSHTIARTYQGTLEGNPAQSYIITLENPTGGIGVTILVAAQPEQFSEEIKKAGIALAASFEFTKVDRSSELAEWKAWLSGWRLTYMHSYNSSGSADVGIYGGISAQRIIDLCPQGNFNFSGKSTVIMDGMAPNSGNSNGNGIWEIVLGADATPHLRLTFSNGEVREYKLEFREEKLFLNGERYFRTNDGDNDPRCF
ncbi:hypothetical protein DFQ04_2545 [Algoriphagus boseongensis]|uniref:Uncharacterized protein n=1 Tax=Algoriphagus boseongensis TaxID=1442587 RepID=A0A4R6T438_9BACT|nr:hypothetical protein [Algoriphagus boseongensis]TDQ16427.1 hypothetical protein DFQ04_2545 [Algoriphagus boseongensis]